ncbi:hypothetical protein [Polymorphospora rubra]|uniref:hypothetical protein n=1 Tax=Polymorphospora rubra TaxID=338584 RepID=UPI0033F5D6FF
MRFSPTGDRRRIVALVALGCVAVGSAAGLATGLVSCAPAASPQARPLSTAEAQRLATMRMTNFQQARVGVHATIGDPGAEVRLIGRVDWSRALAYLSVSGPGAGERRGLLQAAPGVLATRPADTAPDDVTPTGTGAVGTVRPADGSAPGTPTGNAVSTAPPDVPPADGWRIERFTASGPDTGPVESFLALLFAIAHDRADAADLIERSESRWLGRDRAGGATVDVLLGPAVPPQPKPTGADAPSTAAAPGTGTAAPAGTAPPAGTAAPSGTARSAPPPAAAPSGTPGTSAGPSGTAAPRAGTPTPGGSPGGAPAGDGSASAGVDASRTGGAATTGPAGGPTSARPAETSLAAMGGAVRYWLDGDARLHRFEALLAGNRPVNAHLDRADDAGITAIDALGGRPVEPRAVTAEEADLLSRMRQRNRALGGGKVTFALPTVPTANLRGTGLVDWRNTVAYVAVGDLDKPGETALIRADRTGPAIRVAPQQVTADRQPPVPPPTDRGWTHVDWRQRGDAQGALDVDVLLTELLALGTGARDDVAALRRSAIRLRTDRIDDTAVTVFEIGRPGQAGAARPGQGRLRYWVDSSGALRRLELRTRTGAFAQLDVDPGRVAYVRPVPRA